jgi:lipopolysaccharide/colanic/teichoic acid biosynthesis glycosyltransferase
MIQRVIHDLEYIRRQSLWLDVRIIAATVFGRRSKENAY